MAKLSVKRGTTSKTTKIRIQDTSKTDGSGLSGLTSGSSGLIAYYIREGDNATVAITLGAGTLGTWSSGGFVEVDATHMKGVYEIGLPNAVLAAGASAIVTLSGATNMADTSLEIELTGPDNQDAVRGGMTALPNAAAGAVGGLELPVTEQGTAQAGGDSTHIVLRAGASATNNIYTGQTIYITAGTGAGESRVVKGYVGSTKTVQVGRAWDTATPDGTSVYTIVGRASPALDSSLGVYLADPGDIASDADARTSGSKMLRWLFNRFANASTETKTGAATATMVVGNDSGTTVTTQAVADDGTAATVGRTS